MTTITKQHNFQIDELRVFPARNCLQLGERQQSLQPKVMEVFQYLAQHQERVVSSDELMAQLWPGRIVTQASVQKSINSLRKVLQDLLGERELIAHYSKRGYQLLVAPIALAQEEPVVQSPISATQRLWPVWLVALLAVAGGLWWVKWAAPLAPGSLEHHKLSFQSITQIATSPVHERDAEPHPSGHYLAYVREQRVVPNTAAQKGILHEEVGGIESQLMIRNTQREDWLIASSQGAWVALAWSPSGRYLAAVERWRQESAVFYDTASDLYTFHVFALDVGNNRLLEKHLLSQWLGQVQSLTWWNESSLEFVATQGPGTRQERYRYRMEDQVLTSLEQPKGAGVPLFSSVHLGHTALVSQSNRHIRVDWLDEQSTIRASWQLDYSPGPQNGSPVDVSWMPDGSGLLAYIEEQQQFLALQRDGQLRELSVNSNRDRRVSRPRYSSDGQALYITETRAGTGLDWLGLTGETQPVGRAHEPVLRAAWSRDGTGLAQVVRRDTQWLLQVAIAGEHFSHVLPALPSGLLWSDDASQLVYQLGRQVFFLNLAGGSTQRLGLESDAWEALAYDVANQRLWVVKHLNGVRNLWLINPQTLQQQQLTFGTLAAAQVYAGHAYFQYPGKAGLWQLAEESRQPLLVAKALEANVQLLAADEAGIYFVTGGPCRESPVYRLVLATGERQVYLARREHSLTTQAFNPNQGVLQRPCDLPDANIIRLH